MAIKNKNGTTFQLRAPNPIMEGQSRWDPDEVTLHNFKWKPVVVYSGHEAVPRTPPKPEPTIAEELFDPTEETIELSPEDEVQPEQTVQEESTAPVVEAQQTIQEETKVEIPQKPISSGKMAIHCLPATLQDYSDDLYGESYKTLQYGEKFVAEAGVVYQSDIEAVFWSKDNRISVGSILYPRSMEKRWWKVMSLEERPLGGQFIHCQVADHQPRFD